MRTVVVAFLIVLGLLLIALVSPSTHDTSLAAWWARVRYQMSFLARAVLALALVAAIVWFVLLPLAGWPLLGR
jgi:hypothetical protein